MPDSTSPTGSPTGTAYAPASDQQSQIDTWPAEQKTKYQAWPSTYQEYFWTLDPDQQKGWWALTDEQKSQVYAMTPEQRLQVWPAIVAQVNGKPAPAGSASPATPAQPAPGAGTAATPAEPATPPTDGMAAGTVSSSTTGNMSAPPAEAMNKKYPICSKTITDSCRNRGGV
ncbi:MAG: hypothetical protein C0409_11910 [Novosphingobium sp.]|nr:hypothetical protein [Novosphingobium sp.]